LNRSENGIFANMKKFAFTSVWYWRFQRRSRARS